ncbi:hypothetical protein AOL_s00076g546 [Orbilia oligospora ATCC 24927]|uniref:Serine hydrolase domain-containing protein n=1 Tax=Arthrobotrys oligospora (strain ATCC 24927 / CBS 115.81 / DSM 1491) TaxID=756982 RepID=G1XA88_ARTOA|nr:hypothetical protein AOL_s00076g546 [Orbilia oligospora ATCC 24927]EGX49905.1 hypothetical protein AOL_s00076g546 [Orbilia oligospora ATCC 24927]
MAMASSPLNILMLHGKTQSGQLFYAKTRALEKHLIKVCAPSRLAFHYPTAPHRLYLRDIPDVDPALLQSDEESDGMYTWWRKDETTGEYKGIKETWKFISEYLDKNGPFIGAIGFSQGAGLAAILASILEPSRPKPQSIISDGFSTTHPPLKFAVAYCGFKAPNDEYKWIYEPKIQTPVLNVLGSLDTVVDEKLMKGLVDVCEGGRVLWHPGGHYVVVKKQWLDAVGVFIRDSINESETSSKSTAAKEEESVEDMEMPF